MLLATCGGDLKLTKWPNCRTIAIINPQEESLENKFEDVKSSNDGDSFLALATNGTPSILTVTNLTDSNNYMNDVKFERNHDTSTSMTEDLTEHKILNLPHVTALNYSRINDENVTIATIDCEIYVYNLNSRQIIMGYESVPEVPEFLEHATRDLDLFVGCQKHIYMYNNDGNIIANFCTPEFEDADLTGLKCHPCDTNVVAGCSGEGYVCLWDINTLNVKFSRKDHSYCSAIDFHRRQDLFGSIGKDKLLNLYDLKTMKNVYQMTHLDSLTSMVFDSFDSGNKLILGTTSGNLYYYDLRKMNESIFDTKLHENPIKKIEFQKSVHFGCTESGDYCQIFNNRISAGMDRSYSENNIKKYWKLSQKNIENATKYRNDSFENVNKSIRDANYTLGVSSPYENANAYETKDSLKSSRVKCPEINQKNDEIVQTTKKIAQTNDEMIQTNCGNIRTNEEIVQTDISSKTISKSTLDTLQTSAHNINLANLFERNRRIFESKLSLNVNNKLEIVSNSNYSKCQKNVMLRQQSNVRNNYYNNGYLRGNSVTVIKVNLKHVKHDAKQKEESNDNLLDVKTLLMENIKNMKSEIETEHDCAMEHFIDSMNKSYLRMRLNVSRCLCSIENRENKRWTKLYSSLQKLVQNDENILNRKQINNKKYQEPNDEEDEDADSIIYTHSVNSFK